MRWQRSSCQGQRRFWPSGADRRWDEAPLAKSLETVVLETTEIRRLLPRLTSHAGGAAKPELTRLARSCGATAGVPPWPLPCVMAVQGTCLVGVRAREIQRFCNHYWGTLYPLRKIPATALSPRRRGMTVPCQCLHATTTRQHECAPSHSFWGPGDHCPLTAHVAAMTRKLLGPQQTW